MNREEIEITEILKRNIKSKYNLEEATYDVRMGSNLIEELIEHEQDTLKEFVEFAKGEFIKANYCYNDTYLDTMLEMFLEERK